MRVSTLSKVGLNAREGRCGGQDVGVLGRVWRGLFEMLVSSGGLQVAVICLLLLAANFGLWSHRTFEATDMDTSEEGALASGEGPVIIVQLDRLAEEIDEGAAGVGEIVALATDLEARLADRPTVAENLLDAVEDLHAAALLSNEEAGGPDGHALIAALGELRRATVDHSLEASRLRAEANAKLAEQLSRLKVLVWLCLALGGAAGAVSVWMFRDRLVERRAREKAERRVDELSRLDRATGLANCMQFQDLMEELIADARPFSLIVIEIDHFWQFNERFGRLAGDVVLKETAHRLKIFAGESGIAARVSGGGFAVMTDETDAKRLTQKLGALVRDCGMPVDFAGQTLTVGVSIGCASANATEHPRVLFSQGIARMAEFALEFARKQPGVNFVLYDAQLGRAFTDRKMIAEDLPGAIANRQLQVYLQPQVDLGSGHVYGFEALVRWQHGERFLPPMELVRVAEESGLIGDLDCFVFEEAVSTVADWNRRYRRNFRISTNFSCLHLTRPETVELILAVLSNHDFSPDLVTIEVTESAQMHADEAALAALSRLREAGCRIAIDDFGTGYSTFGYLQEIAFDEVKIDRSLVTPVDTSETAQRILKTIIALADAMAQAVVVEGVENQDQVDIIRSLGAKHAQGFLFGKPLPATEALADATFGRHVMTPGVGDECVAVGA